MLAYKLWLERNSYNTALLYSLLIGVLVPAFHYVLVVLPGLPPDSLLLRFACTACSIVVAGTLLFVRGARRYASVLQFVQGVVALCVIAALVVNSGDQNLYIASGLLVIIGAQNAFYDPRALAAAMAIGFLFMAGYSAYRGLFWTPDGLATLIIYGTGYTLAFIPASLHIRSQRTAILNQFAAEQAMADVEETHTITHLGKWILNMQTGVIECSDEVLRIFGLPLDTPSSELAELYRRSLPAEDRSRVDIELERAQSTAEEFTLDHRIERPDGTTRWVQLRGKHEYDSVGRAVRRLGTLMDISERKEAQLSLERLARYDQLTGLPNRATMREALVEALERAERGGEICAVLFLDLNRFKDVNDTLGHTVGDLLLKAVADRIRLLLPEQTLVARWGGDEFVAVLESIDSEAFVERICRQAIQGLSESFYVNSYEFSVAASIGVALYPAHGTDPEVLIRSADTAMYVAKEQSIPPYAMFAAHMHEGAARRHHIQNQLQTAVGSDSLVLHYQPIVDVQSNRIVAAEALLRLTAPDGRIHPPSEFIAIAEETGAIVAIGKWAIETAVRQAMRWRIEGSPISMAVNISPRQLSHPDFVEMVANVLRDNNADPSVLEIEITESALVPNAEADHSVLERIKRMGIRIAVDDFGTGYSSFSYLKRLPLDTLKIDRTFVEGIERDVDRSLAESIISIAHKLHLSVTAEGVETLSQRDVLTGLGCDRLQGYLISKPLPLAAFEDFVQGARAIQLTS
ncbi:MAG TPA: EAL domain-containing protein [Candidatus Acidoferrum sp.]|nr:EAL domain-containing protein [Candidatus Acidoferrum sp.]